LQFILHRSRFPASHHGETKPQQKKNEAMKAIVSTNHGPPEVLKLTELPKPIPEDDEILIRVHAATVTPGDVMLRKLHPFMLLPMRLFGVKRKTTPGHEFAGMIVETGSAVTKFKVGDQVFGTTTGLKVGANAEFVCVPENGKMSALAHMSAKASYEEAAALPVGGMTALEILNRGNIQHGDKVLIYGASGSVGTYAVQIASNLFGGEVTGVCSTANVALVQSLGASHVIDYTQEDFTQISHTYDVVFDAVGKITLPDVKENLTEGGTYITVQTTTRESLESLKIIKDLFETGKIFPVIDRRYPLDKTAEAHRYVETRRKKGNVIITVIPS